MDMNAGPSRRSDIDDGIVENNGMDEDSHDSDVFDSPYGPVRKIDGSQLYAPLGPSGIRMGNLKGDLNYLSEVLPCGQVITGTYGDLPWSENDHDGRLCDTCRDLQLDDSKDDPASGLRFSPVSTFARLDTLPNLPELTAAAEGGCSFCLLLKTAIQRPGVVKQTSTEVGMFISEAKYHWNAKKKAVKRAEKKWREKYEDEGWSFLSLLVQVGDNESFELWFKISAPADVHTAWLGISEKPPIQFNDNEKRLGRWVANHTQSCQFCQRAPQRGQPPTRLIDVGSSIGNEDPRLIKTAEHNIYQQSSGALPGYLILSYCWGNSAETCKTLTDNFEDYQNGMPIEVFPATCRDAIHVTRSLGFRYLWIDAFCIIQDDEKDWLYEAETMVDAYKNAFLTIVPLRSQSSHDGFLHTSPRGAAIPFESKRVRGLRGQYWVHEIQPYPTPDDQPRSALEQCVSLLKSPHWLLSREKRASIWVTRGWTFQESLMSQKALVFGTESTYFQCGRMIYAKDGGRGEAVLHIDGSGDYLGLPDKHRGKREILGRFWYRLINSYTERKFTRQTDRLPAISSLARAITERLPAQDQDQDQYVAGLFISDLTRGLIWEKEPEPIPKVHGFDAYGFDAHLKRSFFRPPDRIAPSWSWASSNGKVVYSPVAWLNTRFEEVHSGVRVEVRAPPEKPYGTPENATLFVKSRAYNCKSMVLRPIPDCEQQWALEDEHQDFQAHLSIDWAIRLPETGEIRVSASAPCNSECGPLHDMHLIPLLIGDPGLARLSEGIQERLYGLLVVPDPDSKDKTSWIRAGLFASYEIGGCQKAKAHFESLREKTFTIV